MPNGRLMNSTARHENHSVSRPPRIRPMANPALATPENSDSALIRSRGSVNVLVISASVFGPAAAAPRPCRTRANSSQPGEAASAPSSEAAVNRATPPRKSRRRPNRSPARPPSSSRPPNTSVYALSTQASPAGENPRSARMRGSATFITVTSSMSMSWQVTMIARASPGLVRARRSTGCIVC